MGKLLSSRGHVVPGGSTVKHLPAKARDIRELGSIPELEKPLEKETTHSNILAWKISWTEEAGGLQSIGCKESDTTEQLGTGDVNHIVD